MPKRDVTAARPAPRDASPLTAYRNWADEDDAATLYEDAALTSLQSRALAYLDAGVPVHFRGPAGMGKTTLALRVAERMDRPVSVITGDRWLNRGDIVGRTVGETSRKVDDTYIQSVRRTETQTRSLWRDAPLATAMREGHVLIYDEFTRASPEANATLLSALEERVLVIADPSADTVCLRAHPAFRVILTSNPQDYQGVLDAPDALLDRMVTFDVDAVSEETERGVVAARSGLDPRTAGRVVGLVRKLRAGGGPGLPPSMRTAILIARLLRAQSVTAEADDPRFVQICLDVLRSRHGPATPDTDRLLTAEIMMAQAAPAPVLEVAQ